MIGQELFKWTGEALQFNPEQWQWEKRMQSHALYDFVAGLRTPLSPEQIFHAVKEAGLLSNPERPLYARGSAMQEVYHFWSLQLQRLYS